MKRDLATAPAVLPINGTKTAVQFTDNGYTRHTAPASLGRAFDERSVQAISPATHKQNQRLAALLKLLNNSFGGEQDGSNLEELENARAESQEAMASLFEKNWSELIHLIGIFI